MNHICTKLIVLAILVSAYGRAQLGFCTGSKGDPIFVENFGNGTAYGPALSAGITTYAFIPGAPQDGQYTLYYHSNQYTTWHYSLDHTPDATNGANGKMLLVNANAVTSGDFYKKTVSGLCVNTTFEFSAWLMNVYNPNTNYCGAGQIPINVRFEIWNESETILLGSGNTGSLMGTSAPLWQQFALVFTTVNETSVVLKMKNNGLGGCGNDLAIDDISFSSCGDLTTVSSPLATGNTYSSCNNPLSIQLNASTAGATPYFYQWQSSPDAVVWSDIAGANTSVYNASGISATTYFRVRAAQDAANLSNAFCSTLSNVFTVNVLAAPAPAVSAGNQVICSDDAIPPLSVNAIAGTNVNWYDAPTGGTLLQAASASFTPIASGTYYAETYNAVTNCIASPRTPVSLTIVPSPDASISGATTICSGDSAMVSFSGTPNAIVTYTINGGSAQQITLDAAGSASVSTGILSADATYTLVSSAIPGSGGCIKFLSDAIVIAVNSLPSASVLSDPWVCYGNSATIAFNGTPGAIVTYSINSGPNQTIGLDGSGNASVEMPNVTSTTVCTLVGVASAGCYQGLSASATTTVIPAISASISASPSVVCASQSSVIQFSGTPNATIIYKVDGGANQTITLDGSGNASVSTAALSSGSTYALVSGTSQSGNCNSALSGSVTVSVNPSPQATISAVSPVCSGASTSIQFVGTPNSSVSYTVNGSSVQNIGLDASGNATITIASLVSVQTYALVQVVAPGPNGCTQPLSQSITVSPAALPTASVQVSSTSICYGQTATVHFSGTPNAVVTFLANGAPQTIALDASGQAAVATGALTSSAAYQLLDVSLGACHQALSDSVSIAVLPVPIAGFSGDVTYCEGEPISIALSSNVAGTTFTWTATQNGVTGAIDGSGSQISQNVMPTFNVAGAVIYTVTPVANGCSGIPIAINVTVYPLPVPQISNGVICTTGSGPTSNQFYVLDTSLGNDHAFQWFFEGSPIPNAFSSTYSASQVGTYSVIATSPSGCASIPVEAVVGEMSQGESLSIVQSADFDANQSVTVTVTGGEGPFLYQMDNGGFQPSNVFTGVTPGIHTITVIDEHCTFLTTTVTVINYPRYFTPNGDGFHDTWMIAGLEGAEIRIFDRYGKLIKQIGSQGSGWDGTYNGKQLPASDYWFTVDYADAGLKKSFKAHFALKR